MTKSFDLAWQRAASPFIVGMFHDLCKVDDYIFEGDSVKHNPDRVLDGHGAKSVIYLQCCSNLILTHEEMLCIRWHMGAFCDKSEWDDYGRAIERYPNVLWTHTADMLAAKVDKI